LFTVARVARILTVSAAVLILPAARTTRLRRVVNLLLQFPERFARRLEPALRHIVLDLNKNDAGIFRPAHAAESREQILFAVAQLAIHQHQRLRAMVAGVDGFGHQLRMLRHA
jgi:hypothetical protein